LKFAEHYKHASLGCSINQPEKHCHTPYITPLILTSNVVLREVYQTFVLFADASTAEDQKTAKDEKEKKQSLFLSITK
jgi:hypothetical protein